MDQLNEDEFMKRHRGGKQMAGLVVVIVGAVLLSQQMGVIFPDWLLSWPMFLIALGVFVGAKHQFRRPGWIFICLVGAAFLMDDFIPGIDIGEYFWPIFIIVAGLYMIFGRENKWEKQWRHHKRFGGSIASATRIHDSSPEDYIDHVAVFGSIEKNIISKDFKGGDIVCIFSGSEINLSQAEIKGPIVMDITNIFGGTTLILPPHWEIKSEMVAILGGIEDKRIQHAATAGNENVLILKGTTILGGIEIKSF